MIDFSPDVGLWGLTVSAFLSATILPGNSEIVLIALLVKYPNLFWLAIAVATVANTLGGMTSYAMGRMFPNKVDSKAIAWLKRYGEWALLLSWVPLIGDALCIAAGWVRVNVWLALLMMSLGKFARYLAIAGGMAWFAANHF